MKVWPTRWTLYGTSHGSKGYTFYSVNDRITITMTAAATIRLTIQATYGTLLKSISSINVFLARGTGQFQYEIVWTSDRR